MKIAIADDYQAAVADLDSYRHLEGHEVLVLRSTLGDPEAWGPELEEVEALVLIQARSRFTRVHLERMPKLRLIAQTGGATSHIDVDACTRRGVAIALAGTKAPYAPAELTWGLILAALRHIPHEVGALRSGAWQSTMGTGLRGRTLGIYGYGRIGKLVARTGAAFEMRVIVAGRSRSTEAATAAGFEAVSTDELFRASDVVSVHLALNEETRGIIDLADLQSMKPTALFVNTSRAGLVAPGALVEALRSGRPGWAAVDVFDDEPVLGAFDPLLQLDNVIATPHLGYVERDTYETYFDATLGDVAAFADGTPRNIVNPEALTRLRS